MLVQNVDTIRSFLFWASYIEPGEHKPEVSSSVQEAPFDRAGVVRVATGSVLQHIRTGQRLLLLHTVSAQ